MAGTVGKFITRLTSDMRFPTLFLIVGGLFLLNLVVPDLIPFYDEILMAMLTVLVASFRRRGPRLGADESSAGLDNNP